MGGVEVPLGPNPCVKLTHVNTVLSCIVVYSLEGSREDKKAFRQDGTVCCITRWGREQRCYCIIVAIAVRMHRAHLSTPLLTYLYNLYFAFPSCFSPFSYHFISFLRFPLFPSLSRYFSIFFNYYLPMKIAILPVKINIFVIEQVILVVLLATIFI